MKDCDSKKDRVKLSFVIDWQKDQCATMLSILSLPLAQIFNLILVLQTIAENNAS